MSIGASMLVTPFPGSKMTEVLNSYSPRNGCGVLVSEDILIPDHSTSRKRGRKYGRTNRHTPWLWTTLVSLFLLSLF